ncbi:MAG: hypothetical protein NC131_20465 [Roseburia sp.]|nr:hypothetical protein [Roseburia sp.]
MKLTAQYTSFYNGLGSRDAAYDMMDKDGNLLKNKVDTGMNLYKHTAAEGMYFGAVYEGSSNSGATLVFDGTQVAVRSYCGSEYGSYEIYIDDELVYTADISDGDGVEIVYLSSLLEDGEHTLTLKGKSGKFNIDSFVLFN